MPKSSKERGAEKQGATPQDSSVQKRASKAVSAALEIDRKTVSKKNRAGQASVAAPEQPVAAEAGPVEPVSAKSRSSRSTDTQKKATTEKTVGRSGRVASELAAPLATAPVADMPVAEPETGPVQAKGNRAGSKARPATTDQTATAQAANVQNAGAAPVKSGRKAGVPAAGPIASSPVASEVSAEPMAGSVSEQVIAPARRGRGTPALPVPEVVTAPLTARTGGRKAAAGKALKPAEVSAPTEVEPAAPAPVAPVSRRGRKVSGQVTHETVAADVPDADTQATSPEIAQAAPETVRPGQRRGRKPRADAATPINETAPVEEPEVAASEADAVPARVARTKPAPRRTRKQRQQDEQAAASAAELESGEASDNPDGEAEETPGAHPAQSLVVEQLRKLGRPVHIRDFERSFTRQGREKLGQYRSDLSGLMDELVHAGLVIQTRKRTYGLPESMNLVRGRFQASKSGFGFVVPDSGGDDYYIPEGQTNDGWSVGNNFLRFNYR